MTPQEELDLVNTLITQAASNGGVAEWQEGAHRVKHYDLRQLLEWKRDLENRVYQASHRITMPVRGVNL